MKRKLWIMYGVLSATAVLLGLATHAAAWPMGIGVAAALAEWAAFLVDT